MLFRSKGKLSPHGKFLLERHIQEELKGGTDCSIEVHGIEGHIPELCDPYVLISGNKKDEVNLVAENVEGKLLKHQKGCHCKFLN